MPSATTLFNSARFEEIWWSLTNYRNHSRNIWRNLITIALNRSLTEKSRKRCGADETLCQVSKIEQFTRLQVRYSFICAQCGLPLNILAEEDLQIEYIEIETENERTQWMESQNELRNAFRYRPMS